MIGLSPALGLVAINPDPSIAPLVEVHWILTRRCQYNCWYCPPHRHDPKAPHANERALMGALECVIRYLGAGPARINLTGGEPTIHPAIVTFVRAAVAGGPIRAVRIVSNLAGPRRLFDRLADINHRYGGVYVVASFHPDHARVEPFLARVEVLASAGVPVLVKVLRRYDRRNEHDQVLERVRRGMPSGAEVTVQGIRQTASEGEAVNGLLDSEVLRRWSDARIASLGSGQGVPLNAEELISRGANRFAGWMCEVGRYSLFIDSDGSFHAALCRPHGWPLANLFDPGAELPRVSSVRCPHAICGCAATIRIPKHAP